MRILNVTVLFFVFVLGGVKLSFASPVDYQVYDKVLKEFVDNSGLVNYRALKNNPDNLDIFIKQVEEADLSGLSENELKTYWINAYNAITLKVVRDAYPVKSIRNINFFLVWEIPRRAAKQKISLGHIEHKIVRPMGDPRIHFALNCASIGCPELPAEPFYPDLLEEQLDFEAREFINNPQKVRLNRERKILYHSEILSWFEEDFLEVAPDLKSYIMKYINDYDREFLENNEVELKTLKYDWNLNKQR